MKIVWSPLALERVEDIARYIAEVGSPRIRELIFGTYRVIYSVKDQVDILTVRRSSQLLRMSELGDDET